jgi:hypothetical protein
VIKIFTAAAIGADTTAAGTAANMMFQALIASIGHLSMRRCNAMRLQCLDDAIEN